jgi:small subunit ribosomal protein S13
MPRILGVDIPADKRIDIALRYIYGIGPVNALEILERANIDPSLRAKALNESQLSLIVNAIQEGKYVTEGDLRRELGMNLKRLQAIKSYRDTAAACRSVGSAPRPTPAPARGPARRWVSRGTRPRRLNPPRLKFTAQSLWQTRQRPRRPPRPRLAR